jgi:hypothetical protein
MRDTRVRLALATGVLFLAAVAAVFFLRTKDAERGARTDITKDYIGAAVGGAPMLKEASLPRQSLARKFRPASASVPPAPTATWKEEKEALRVAIEMGDAQAAHRLANDTLRCKTFQSLKARVDATVQMYVGPKATPEVLAQQDRRLANMQQEIKTATALCDDTPSSEIDEALYPALKQAALLGDQKAATCLVDGSIFSDAQSRETLDALRADYKQYSPQIADQAVKSGSWPMVTLLIDAYSDPASPYNAHGWLRDFVDPDPLAAYSYLLLERRGLTNSALQSAMDQTLANLREVHQFSNEQLKTSQLWADQTYSSYFSNQPFPESGDIELCGVDAPK